MATTQQRLKNGHLRRRHVWLVGKLFRRKKEAVRFLDHEVPGGGVMLQNLGGDGQIETQLGPPPDKIGLEPETVIPTTIPPALWAGKLLERRDFFQLAAVFRGGSYHARTDTADQKKRLAKQFLVQRKPATVSPLLKMLIHRGVPNSEIAELLIEIDDSQAAPLLRQLYEMRRFDRQPSGMAAFLERHFGKASY